MTTMLSSPPSRIAPADGATASRSTSTSRTAGSGRRRSAGARRGVVFTIWGSPDPHCRPLDRGERMARIRAPERARHDDDDVVGLALRPVADRRAWSRSYRVMAPARVPQAPHPISSHPRQLRLSALLGIEPHRAKPLHDARVDAQQRPRLALVPFLQRAQVEELTPGVSIRRDLLERACVVHEGSPKRGTCQDVAPAIPSAWPGDPLARPARGVACATPRGLRRASAHRAPEDVGAPLRCRRTKRHAAFAEAAHVTCSDGSLAPFVDRPRKRAVISARRCRGGAGSAART